MLFCRYYVAIGLVALRATCDDDDLCSMLMMCTRQFLRSGEGFHVEAKKGVYHDLVHIKGIPSMWHCSPCFHYSFSEGSI